MDKSIIEDSIIQKGELCRVYSTSTREGYLRDRNYYHADHSFGNIGIFEYLRKEGLFLPNYEEALIYFEHKVSTRIKERELQRNIVNELKREIRNQKEKQTIQDTQRQNRNTKIGVYIGIASFIISVGSLIVGITALLYVLFDK